MRTNTAAFGQPHQSSHVGYYGHQQQPQYSNAMYYQQPLTSARGDFLTHQAGYDTRKRGFDDLNDFFGNAKRRQVDPTSYEQVSRSLIPLHDSLSMHTGGIATAYMTAPSAPSAVPVGGAGSHGPLAQHYYLPMPNLRTKGDLEQADQILEQMQSTVYENSGSPQGTHTQYAPAYDVRHHSPVARHPVSNDHYATSAAHLPSPLTAVSSSHAESPPSHTPPSSSMSYTSGHSPSASSSGLSPTSRHSSAASVAYPSLPPVTYAGQATSMLGSSFNPVERRLSGGMLQRASGDHRVAGEYVEMGGTTPKASEAVLASASSPSEDSDGSEPESYEAWLQNIRVIESLREYVQSRLKRCEFERDSPADERIDPMLAARQAAGKPPLYPDLRMSVD